MSRAIVAMGESGSGLDEYKVRDVLKVLFDRKEEAE